MGNIQCTSLKKHDDIRLDFSSDYQSTIDKKIHLEFLQIKNDKNKKVKMNIKLQKINSQKDQIDVQKSKKRFLKWYKMAYCFKVKVKNHLISSQKGKTNKIFFPS